MFGAICGDIIGSVYEFNPTKSKQISLSHERMQITDDSVLTVAVAESVCTGVPYAETIRSIGNMYPYAGYGGYFRKWLADDSLGAYNSWGNGSAMRVSPIGWAFNDEKTVLQEAQKSAECTHNHPEGIKGAQAVALAIFRARTGSSKDDICAEIADRFEYDLNRSTQRIRQTYEFEVSCQKSVPEAIIAFLESSDYEDAVKNAISLGGDADTQACIAGAIAEAYYGDIPDSIISFCVSKIDDYLMSIILPFCRVYVRGRITDQVALCAEDRSIG